MSARPSTARAAAAAAAALAVTLVVNTITAIAMGPWIGPSLGSAFVRDPASDGLLFPALIGGYAVIGVVAVLFQVGQPPASFAHVALRGLLLGLAVFFGGHLVIAGWSRLPAVPMAVAGLLDALSVVAGALAGAAVLRRIGKAQEARHG